MTEPEPAPEDGRRRCPDWLVVDARLFAAIAAALAAGAVFLAVFQISEGQDAAEDRANRAGRQVALLSAELECRSRAAQAGTLATLDMVAATGRGLAVLVAQTQDDDQLRLLVAEELGAADETELRQQVKDVLDASKRAEAAAVARLQAEDACEQIAREQVDGSGSGN
jgi:hypothetical protein